MLQPSTHQNSPIIIRGYPHFHRLLLPPVLVDSLRILNPSFRYFQGSILLCEWRRDRGNSSRSKMKRGPTFLDPLLSSCVNTRARPAPRSLLFIVRGSRSSSWSSTMMMVPRPKGIHMCFSGVSMSKRESSSLIWFHINLFAYPSILYRYQQTEQKASCYMPLTRTCSIFKLPAMPPLAACMLNKKKKGQATA